MYHTRISAVNGKTCRDDTGRELVRVGNMPVSPGDWVWTDGRCVYGSVYNDRRPEIVFGDDKGGILLIESVIDGNINIVYLTKSLSIKKITGFQYSPDVKLYSGFWNWICAGEKTAYMRYDNHLYNLMTGEDLGEYYKLYDAPLDACIDENKDILTMPSTGDPDIYRNNGELVRRVERPKKDFRNNSNAMFLPIRGTIHPDGKFNMVGSISAPNASYWDRSEGVDVEIPSSEVDVTITHEKLKDGISIADVDLNDNDIKDNFETITDYRGPMDGAEAATGYPNVAMTFYRQFMHEENSETLYHYDGDALSQISETGLALSFSTGSSYRMASLVAFPYWTDNGMVVAISGSSNTFLYWWYGIGNLENYPRGWSWSIKAQYALVWDENWSDEEKDAAGLWNQGKEWYEDAEWLDFMMHEWDYVPYVITAADVSGESVFAKKHPIVMQGEKAGNMIFLRGLDIEYHWNTAYEYHKVTNSGEPCFYKLPHSGTEFIFRYAGDVWASGYDIYKQKGGDYEYLEYSPQYVYLGEASPGTVNIIGDIGEMSFSIENDWIRDAVALDKGHSLFLTNKGLYLLTEDGMKLLYENFTGWNNYRLAYTRRIGAVAGNILHIVNGN